MVEVYFYLPAAEIDNIVECGLKLSRWYDREIKEEWDTRKCMAALLNPRDDPEKYNSAEYGCVKLQVHPRSCYVAERHLYVLGLQRPDIMKMYYSSMTPVESYQFGTYRLPECLVMTTVLPGQISRLDKRLDSPILYNSSEELFLDNLVETLCENGSRDVIGTAGQTGKSANAEAVAIPEGSFKDTLLYCYFEKLACKGLMKAVNEDGNGIVVFEDIGKNRRFPLRKPLWLI